MCPDIHNNKFGIICAKMCTGLNTQVGYASKVLKLVLFNVPYVFFFFFTLICFPSCSIVL